MAAPAKRQLTAPKSLGIIPLPPAPARVHGCDHLPQQALNSETIPPSRSKGLCLCSWAKLATNSCNSHKNKSITTTPVCSKSCGEPAADQPCRAHRAPGTAPPSPAVGPPVTSFQPGGSQPPFQFLCFARRVPASFRVTYFCALPGMSPARRRRGWLHTSPELTHHLLVGVCLSGGPPTNVVNFSGFWS